MYNLIEQHEIRKREKAYCKQQNSKDRGTPVIISLQNMPEIVSACKHGQPRLPKAEQAPLGSSRHY